MCGSWYAQCMLIGTYGATFLVDPTEHRTAGAAGQLQEGRPGEGRLDFAGQVSNASHYGPIEAVPFCRSAIDTMAAQHDAHVKEVRKCVKLWLALLIYLTAPDAATVARVRSIEGAAGRENSCKGKHTHTHTHSHTHTYTHAHTHIHAHSHSHTHTTWACMHTHIMYVSCVMHTMCVYRSVHFREAAQQVLFNLFTYSDHNFNLVSIGMYRS